MARAAAAAASWLAALAIALSGARGVPMVQRQNQSSGCLDKFQIPAKLPELAVEYNGIQLPDVCIAAPGPHHVFVVGDWGGIIFEKNIPPVPADKRSKLFKNFHRQYIYGVDDRAQLLVASQMRLRATVSNPDYVLNVGDNFYWGGVEGMCGSAPVQKPWSNQWDLIFENVYWGSGLNDKPWLGVLGNHDYGGFKFTSAWEKVIGYTWASPTESTGRWITPALYWAQTVKYTDLSVDYIFADSNAAEAWHPTKNPSHNICGLEHSGSDATCGRQGPSSPFTCPDWFWRLWDEQFHWMVSKMEQSQSTYLMVVTHFPPKWFRDTWQCLTERYGIDMFFSGHIHHQALYGETHPANWITSDQAGGTCVVVSGGGGGITSEGIPSRSGDDDEYGFVDLKLTQDYIEATAISHGGKIRRVERCHNRKPIYTVDCSRFGHASRRLLDPQQENASFV